MKMIPLTCHKCSCSFERSKNEIDRQIRNGRQYFFCSLSCAQSHNKKTTSEILSACLWCNNEFKSTTHKRGRKCCSIDCATKYAQSKVNPLVHQLAMTLIGNETKIFPKLKTFICVICEKSFEKMMRNDIDVKKTCSKRCYIKMLKKWTRENPNCGGELGYKHYDYNGVKMDSSWEVDIAKWMDNENIKWERSRKKYMLWWTDDNGNKRRYYPDFYLPEYDVYLDPKNKYKIENDRIKMERVIKENRITLYWGLLENVKKEIDILRNI
jgi:hypothetical protein